MRRARALAAAAVLCFGCAGIPTPAVLDQADAVSRSPSAMDAKVHAAPAWAAAERRRAEAHDALAEGPPARAQLLAEEAIASYEEAIGLARLAKAELRAEAGAAAVEKLSAELAQLDTAMSTAAADVHALELRLAVAQGAEPPGASGAAKPEREAARREAARGMAVQGRVLCGAARLLGAGAVAPAAPPSDKEPEDPTSPAVLARDLADAERKLTDLEGQLGAQAPTPIDLATRARAGCLSVLTRVRRAKAAASSGAGVSGSADALLAELSGMGQKSGLAPSRDERGVVISLRDVFDGDAPKPLTRTLLEELDRVASSHPAFAVAVVLHTDKPVAAAERARWEERAGKIAAAFSSVPAARRLAVVAGDALPVLPGKNAKNARVEVVFIAPEAL